MSQHLTETTWEEEIGRVAHGIRRRVLEYTIINNGGYLSQACSAAEILAALYTKIMNLGPSEAPLIPPLFSGVPSNRNKNYQTGAIYNGPNDPNLDRFFLSPTHYSLVLYATLIEVGRLAPEALNYFNKDGYTMEMIGAEHSPGMEVMTGSLAQGLSQAAGIAFARKFRKDSGRVCVMMSDGEFQEGQTWETFQTMAHYQLDNMIVYVDVNRQQCDGLVTEVMNIEPLADKLIAFGAEVHQVDGHNPNALVTPSLNKKSDGQPLVVLCYTDPCAKMEFLRKRAPKLHYIRFTNEQEREEYNLELQKF
ncbi:MAG TPA: 1-deoxy-D-xylulose-5-phosphate synthase N-terminal domain-containing protein [Bacillota bacterium]|nr:1-deoxy-D-xylulose-5-phosphate synthase N-terminal domain-containing protein [Bacillota bacterium]HPO96800.1 1-deoxy-D-xylulose-5-phosphate synthase N-terminal domain-containing protein [Bacillota bacterium]